MKVFIGVIAPPIFTWRGGLAAQIRVAYFSWQVGGESASSLVKSKGMLGNLPNWFLFVRWVLVDPLNI